ncbi:MAG: phosphatidylglycerophosphatase A [Chloroflexota bacterium]|nr:phosphatidylglycerophosphatase A [Chloroflexota bacterium]
MLTSFGKLIAIGFGTGLSPVAPGTAGSLAAVAIYFLVALLAGDLASYLSSFIGVSSGAGLSPVPPGPADWLQVALFSFLVALLTGDLATYILVALIVVGLPVGIWATGLLVSEADPDPGQAVWDEFVGMWITCLLLPPTALWLGAAFICFRFFDVVKPWPARRLEELHGGLGIMADDVAAGIYGAVLLNLAHFIWVTWISG